jgi:PAS domain S-box-containing protein
MRIERSHRLNEERYRKVVEDMPALICRFLPDGTLTFVNEAYCQYFNKTRPELIGKNFYRFIPEEERAKVKEHYSSLSQKNPMITYEHQVKAPDGSIHWQRWTDRGLIFDEAGNPTEYQSIGIDITERKLAEEALRGYAEAIQDTNRKKTEFVSDVSHELRTPLASIKGFAATVRSDEDMDPATRQEFLRIVEEETDRLTRIINDLLDLSRIESGRIKLKQENIKLGDLIRKNVLTIRDQAKKKNLELKMRVPEKFPSVFADSDKISQVILNLLGNAIKYTKQGEVSISAREDNGHVLVEVSDTGIGIAKKDLPKIFEKFQRIEKAEAGTKGTGLGLSIVKALVELQGGNVFVESEPGKGSKFGFRLPAIKE